MNKFEHVPVLATRYHWQGGRARRPAPMSHVQGGLGPGDPYLVRSHVQGGSLYGEVQCILGNGHMGTDVPSRQTHTHD